MTSFVLTNDKNAKVQFGLDKPGELKATYKAAKSDYIAFVKERNSIKSRTKDVIRGNDEEFDYKLNPDEEKALESLQKMWKDVPKHVLDYIKQYWNHFCDMREFHEVLNETLKTKSPAWVKYTQSHQQFCSKILESQVTSVTTCI